MMLERLRLDIGPLGFRPPPRAPRTAAEARDLAARLNAEARADRARRDRETAEDLHEIDQAANVAPPGGGPATSQQNGLSAAQIYRDRARAAESEAR